MRRLSEARPQLQPRGGISQGEARGIMSLSQRPRKLSFFRAVRAAVVSDLLLRALISSR